MINLQQPRFDKNKIYQKEASNQNRINKNLIPNCNYSISLKVEEIKSRGSPLLRGPTKSSHKTFAKGGEMHKENNWPQINILPSFQK